MANKFLISDHFKKVYSSFLYTANVYDDILNTYGIEVSGPDISIGIEELHRSLNKLPPQLVKDCGIKSLAFQDMGPSMEYYPNHGRYCDSTLVLNTFILRDPKVEKDGKGNCLNKFDLILYHELGHGLDEMMGPGQKCLSDLPDWLELSKWSDRPVKGHRQICIRCKNKPDLIDEWYYSPEAEFPRYYGKRNPWDDWADAFSFYVGGLKGRLCRLKREYFDNILGKYYG